ncbi:hypothetical protein [Desulfobacula sp.]|uniref:hypothetical protein n=1 Tax=Desulfobacula sp. TaxID=2593537 RepID=UPI0026025B37|nr:hypothetical protein [Desulfobacula sp.]
MMDQIKINGIRLNKNFIQITQGEFDVRDQTGYPLYQTMETHRLNMVFMVLNTVGSLPFVSGSIPSKHFKKMPRQAGDWTSHPNVCTVSIYPHHYRLQLLGGLLSFLGGQKMSFQHMVSSNAMITFVVDQHHCDGFVEMISSNFDLPESHVPFEQEENDELTQFLKKKYPETRATYVEEKIKTYGVTLVSDLTLEMYPLSFDQAVAFGKHLQSLEDKADTFSHVSAHMMYPEQIHLFLVTAKSPGMPARQACPVELLSFHGPHFGDRHSIISRALNCLVQKSIPVLQTGCTGASISMVLPRGKGAAAKQALMDVFEGP